MAEERRAGHHQNGGIHEEGQVERHQRIDQVVAAGLLEALPRGRNSPRLHQGGVQIQVVRHHRRADDADRHVKRFAAAEYKGRGTPERGEQPLDDFSPARLRQQDLDQEAEPDRADQEHDKRLGLADPQTLDRQEQKRVEAGNDESDDRIDAEQQIEPDHGADDFRQVAGRHGDFAENPQGDRKGTRIGFAAGLGQVPAGNDAQPGRQRLQEDGHGVGHQEHPDQLVIELGSPFDVGRPIAGVHIADADEIRRTQKGKQPLEETGIVNRHRAMDVLQGPVGSAVQRPDRGTASVGRHRRGRQALRPPGCGFRGFGLVLGHGTPRISRRLRRLSLRFSLILDRKPKRRKTAA